MKSLKESLFDDDIITKEYTFGDLYEFYDLAEDSSKWPLEKFYKSSLIKKYSGENDIIRGLVKIILNIKIQPNFERSELKEKLSKLEDLYTSYTLNAYRRNTVAISIYPYGYRKGHLLVLSDWTMEDADTIEINMCKLTLRFKRRS